MPDNSVPEKSLGDKKVLFFSKQINLGGEKNRATPPLKTFFGSITEEDIASNKIDSKFWVHFTNLEF